jgi:hypothetical protein
MGIYMLVVLSLTDRLDLDLTGCAASHLDTPPRRNSGGCDLRVAISHDKSQAIEDAAVDLSLTRKANERISIAFDLESGEMAINHGDIYSRLPFTDA